MQRVIQQIMPFIFLGVALMALSFGLILLFYLIIFGTIVGFVLFAIRKVRDYLKTPEPPKKSKKPENGRIIDSDEWHKL